MIEVRNRCTKSRASTNNAGGDEALSSAQRARTSVLESGNAQALASVETAHTRSIEHGAQQAVIAERTPWDRPRFLRTQRKRSRNEGAGSCVTSVEQLNGELMLDKSIETGDDRALSHAASLPAVWVDGDMRVRSHTAALTQWFTISAQDHGRHIGAIEHQLESLDMPRVVAAVLERRGPLEQTVRTRDQRKSLLMRAAPHENGDAGALISFVDVSHVASAAEQQQRVLLSEANHRVRNMLQVVISLCNQTLHRAQDLKHFERSFMGRMQALARAYELLSRAAWGGVHVQELVRTQLANFASEGPRCQIEGEDVEIAAQGVLPLSLVLYELATNATKYGACSSADGRVKVAWRTERGEQGVPELVLDWIETGGPSAQPPARYGFGLELITRQLRHELRGRTNLDFATQGLRVTLVLPRDPGALDSDALK